MKDKKEIFEQAVKEVCEIADFRDAIHVIQMRQKVAEKFIPGLVEQGVPILSAVIMSGDALEAEIASRAVQLGFPALDALWTVGSYARFNWAVEHLSLDELLELLPDLWVSSDPDDTRIEYLKLWRKAYNRKGRIITDDKELEYSHNKYELYRGQLGDTLGISWSLSREVATKFAKTGGFRQNVSGGKLFRALAKRGSILAYLTGRGEEEIIIDPKELSAIREIRP